MHKFRFAAIVPLLYLACCLLDDVRQDRSFAVSGDRLSSVRGGAYVKCTQDVLNDCNIETLCAKTPCAAADAKCSSPGQDVQKTKQWTTCKDGFDSGWKDCTNKQFVCSDRTPCDQTKCVPGQLPGRPEKFICTTTSDPAAPANKHDGATATGNVCKIEQKTRNGVLAIAMLNGFGFNPFE